MNKEEFKKMVKRLNYNKNFINEEIDNLEDLNDFLKRNEMKCFYVYDDTPNRYENAKKYIYNILKDNGYDTNINDYKTDYHRACGEDCIEVYVNIDCDLKDFQGNTPEYDNYIYKSKATKKRKGRY